MTITFVFHEDQVDMNEQGLHRINASVDQSQTTYCLQIMEVYLAPESLTLARQLR